MELRAQSPHKTWPQGTSTVSTSFAQQMGHCNEPFAFDASTRNLSISPAWVHAPAHTVRHVKAGSTVVPVTDNHTSTAIDTIITMFDRVESFV